MTEPSTPLTAESRTLVDFILREDPWTIGEGTEDAIEGMVRRVEEAVRREAPVAPPSAKTFNKGRWAGAYDALAVVRSLNGDGFHEPSDEALSSAEAAIRRMIEERHGPALTEPVADTATVEELTPPAAEAQRDPGTPTAEQQERFKWAANERADRAEAQRDRLRAALREASEAAHVWTPSGHSGRFEDCPATVCQKSRAALSDPTQEKP